MEFFEETLALISPYVEKDPTAFCTYEEFLKGADTLKEFCLLRAESIRGQLDGSIPSTSEGQTADSSALRPEQAEFLQRVGPFEEFLIGTERGGVLLHIRGNQGQGFLEELHRVLYL